LLRHLRSAKPEGKHIMPRDQVFISYCHEDRECWQRSRRGISSWECDMAGQGDQNTNSLVISIDSL
jgi:hypothetical protein